MRRMLRLFLVLLGTMTLWAWALQGLALGEDAQDYGFSPSAKSTKLSPSIRHAIQGRNRRMPSTRGWAFDAGAMDIDANGLQVYIELREWSRGVLEQLQAWHVVIEITDPGLKLVQGRIPLDIIEQVAGLPFVKFIRLPDYGYSKQQGSVGTEGDSVIGANLARQALGVTGTGVRVGVISDGIRGLSQSIASGDLPASGITSMSFRADGNLNAGAEGTALLEIIHDIAPGAQLFLANFDTSLAFIQAVNWLADTAGGANPRRGTPGGVDIIVQDVGFYNVGPYDGSSSVSQALSGAVTRGVVVVAAVGNEARSHYQGFFADTDGDTLHEFDVSLGQSMVDNGGETLNVTVQPGETIRILLQWDDPFGASGNDYDLCVHDPPDNPSAPILCSTTTQNGHGNPTEFIAITRTASTPGTLGVRINNFQGRAAPRTFDLFILGGTQNEFVVPESSVPNGPDAFHVLSVGAVDWQTPGVPEAFSSRGPTNDGRLKPEFVAPDGVSVTGAGGFPTTFFGTSAAAPHAAAVAALMLEANPSLTPPHVQDLLEQTAAPLGSPIPNLDSGFGRIDAFNVVQTAAVRSEVGVYRSSNGGWFRYSRPVVYFGGPGFFPVPGDYDGDGRPDEAVYELATGHWFIRGSTGAFLTHLAFGGPGYVPVPGDYDGDWRTDTAVYEQATGHWFIALSSGPFVIHPSFGGPGFFPVPGDYDGDGRDDFAVYQASTGHWFLDRSSAGFATHLAFGGPGYVPVPGDYDGDGRTDTAVYEQATGHWFIALSSGPFVIHPSFGGPGFLPVPVDYDGDGRADFGVWDEETGEWFVNPSSGGVSSVQWGAEGDMPLSPFLSTLRDLGLLAATALASHQ